MKNLINKWISDKKEASNKFGTLSFEYFVLQNTELVVVISIIH